MKIFKIGDYVKIQKKGENFWVAVTKINKKTIDAIIMNEPIVYKKKWGDYCRFPISEIIDVK